jgi:hypothetical protein
MFPHLIGIAWKVAILPRMAATAGERIARLRRVTPHATHTSSRAPVLHHLAAQLRVGIDRIAELSESATTREEHRCEFGKSVRIRNEVAAVAGHHAVDGVAIVVRRTRYSAAVSAGQAHA